jgi:hypothetical protein
MRRRAWPCLGVYATLLVEQIREPLDWHIGHGEELVEGDAEGLLELARVGRVEGVLKDGASGELGAGGGMCEWAGSPTPLPQA